MEVRLYLDAAGRSPYARWYADLDRHARNRVDVALARLRAGNASNLKSVGSGVSELRIDWGPGLRIYIGQVGGRLVVLLGGGTKARQQDDIATAKLRWLDYKKRGTE
jgi:putative addiction module killer protein